MGGNCCTTREDEKNKDPNAPIDLLQEGSKKFDKQKAQEMANNAKAKSMEYLTQAKNYNYKEKIDELKKIDYKQKMDDVKNYDYKTKLDEAKNADYKGKWEAIKQVDYKAKMAEGQATLKQRYDAHKHKIGIKDQKNEEEFEVKVE